MGKRIDYGSPLAIVDGVRQLRYSSPSTLAVADPASEGCLRKAWYQLVKKLRSPQSKSQELGEAVHAEIENYLLTGEKKLGPIAMSGMHAIPPPGLDLLVEKPIAASLATARVRAAGVPIVGYIDLVHARGTNKGGNSIDDVDDPPNTVEVLDWKTTSDKRWIKSAKEVAETIQMTTYGKWVTTVSPKVEHVRLSHVYFVTKGAPHARKVSLRVLPEAIDRRWEHVEGVALSLRHAVAEQQPDRIDANTSVCDRFNGCAARGVCTAGMHRGFRNIAGATASSEMIAEPLPNLTLPGDTMAINFLDSLRNDTDAPPPKPDPSATLGLGGLLDSSASKAKAEAEELAKIKAEESAAKERQAFLAICDKIEALGQQIPGLGFPHLGGDAAKVYAQAKGYTLQGGGYAGSGKLGTVKPDGNPAVMIMDAPSMAKLLVDLENHVKHQKIIEANGQVQAPASQPTPQAAKPTGLLSPETPASAPPQSPAPAPMTITTPPDEPKAKRTRAKKTEEPAVPQQAPATVVNSTAPVTVVNNAAPAASTPQQRITGAISLMPMVDHLVASLQKHFEGQGWQIADIRCAPQDSPLGFGKWKGGLHALTLEQAAKIPPGQLYTIDTRGNEFAEIVAGALAQYARTTGTFTLVIDAVVDGSVIRGIR